MEKITVLYTVIAFLATMCLILFLLWYSVYTKPDKKVASTNAIVKRKVNDQYEVISVSSKQDINYWYLQTTAILNPGDQIEIVALKK